jgi:hypothetical protein
LSIAKGKRDFDNSCKAFVASSACDKNNQSTFNLYELFANILTKIFISQRIQIAINKQRNVTHEMTKANLQAGFSFKFISLKNLMETLRDRD